MESIRNIFKIGLGPSSSHTMGPGRAAKIFKNQNPDSSRFEVVLYGSLALTGKGHLTDIAITEALAPIPSEIIWLPCEALSKHPNALTFKAFNANNEQTKEWTVYSIGGGEITDDNSTFEKKEIYPLSKMEDILEWCEQNGKTLWEYVNEYEDKTTWEYLSEVWEVMKSAIKRGIENEGRLPGPLNIQRKASTYFIKASGYKASLQSRSLVFAYALAVAEENAAGGIIVTAPTCGSCGVLPAVLYHLQCHQNFSDIKIIRALATAGLIANLIKTNASLAGAEVGCQGEIGSACAMAAAAANQLFGGTPSQIEYAAEMGLEHHLGLTCDPVCGLVQIPCIERNAFAAARALDANLYASLSDGRHYISFDHVVSVMNQTGHDLPSLYKETSLGGLAMYAHNQTKKGDL